MDITLHKTGKKKSEKISVSDAVFAAAYNEPLIHQVLTAYMAGSRAGTKAQKTRADVRGGGRKPWKQKGLGRARAGTIRSPLWRGGGVTFAARPRTFTKKVNRKMYQGAMRSIFSELVRQERLQCIDIFKLEEPKTKAAIEFLSGLGLRDVLIITDEVTENLYLSTRNLPSVEVIDTNEINPYSLIGFENVLMTKAAIQRVEAWLS
ncbi:MAG: 50S ribosomal protein L4 [Gammaproteobacteria bacterium RIFCSPLOWO2_12_FULL_52_10]|nr:MAG: 50S ribosomal protein L4 [Gammaproteobacteria bacterium RIFCSPLOWO2_12_FULL_52_10]